MNLIDPSPFYKCKECVHEYCGQANMPCRACTFGSKFERDVILPKIKFPKEILNYDVGSWYPASDLIIKNKDKSSMYPDSMDAFIYAYCANDVMSTKELYEIMNRRVDRMKRSVPEIKDVIFNPPATIVLWKDRTKTVVKAQGGEPFDPEKGLAMAICKKLYGNTGSFNNVFHKYIDKYEEKVRRERFANIDEMHLYGADDIKRVAEQATAAINRVSKAISDAVGNKHEKD